MRVLFLDPIAIKPYTEETLRDDTLGGTEATLLRIARGLTASHQVYIAEAARKYLPNEEKNGICYTNFEYAPRNVDIVILLRQHIYLAETAKRYPKARLFFWMHNLPPRDLHLSLKLLCQHRYEIIAVSHFHREVIIKRLKGRWYQQLFARLNVTSLPIHVLYNPIADDLEKNDTDIERNQMLFMSSLYKGFDQVLEKFAVVKQVYPDYQLLVACHSDRHIERQLPEHVHFLGALPHQQVLDYARTSFCIFYPQTLRAETFGLIFAEANAVGTPVLAHDFGAAKEVLNGNEQVINAHSNEMMLAKIAAWREMRPSVSARACFRLSKVLLEWQQVLHPNPCD